MRNCEFYKLFDERNSDSFQILCQSLMRQSQVRYETENLAWTRWFPHQITIHIYCLRMCSFVLSFTASHARTVGPMALIFCMSIGSGSNTLNLMANCFDWQLPHSCNSKHTVAASESYLTCKNGLVRVRKKNLARGCIYWGRCVYWKIYGIYQNEYIIFRPNFPGMSRNA